MQEEFYIKLVAEKNVLGLVLDVLAEELPGDHLLSSAALELFEHIKKENIKDLVKHLVATRRETLLSLSYMQTFHDLLLRYDQTKGYTANMDYFLDNEEDVGRKPPQNARMMEHLSVDPAQEAYWNASDDEEDEDPEGRTAEKTPATNGASTPSKPLVDYPSDEEGDENADPMDKSQDSDNDEIVHSDASTSPVAPPERISEKRRREEDEEDELGKLMQNKRRNSSSSNTNSSVTASMGRRRKSCSTGTGNGTPKKIAISLSPGLRAGSKQDDES